jgi:hypothetical protein
VAPVTDDESGASSTRLVLPVPEVAQQVPGAHIALLDPFLPTSEVDAGVIAELGELFAEIVPFRFALGEPARFPSGASYLPPQPVGVFRSITHTLRRSFPELIGPPTPLYAAIPHLALPDDDTVLANIRTPVQGHGREALLLGPDGTVLETFPFGTSAA